MKLTNLNHKKYKGILTIIKPRGRIKSLLGLFFIFYSANTLNAQEIKDRDSITTGNQLNKMDDTTKKDTLPHQNIPGESYYVIPESLPARFLDLPESNDTVFYTIGVSNPETPKEQAMKIAKYRANLLYALLNNLTIKNVTENYEKKTDSKYPRVDTEFREMTKFSTKFKSRYNTTVIDSHYTKYGEAITLIKYTRDTSKASRTFTAAGSSFAAYDDSPYNPSLHHFTLKYSSRIKQDSSIDTSNYHFRKYKKQYDLESAFNDSLLATPYDYFYYSTTVSGNNRKQSSLRLRYGLWNGFFSSFIREATLQAKQKASKVKNVGDLYSNRVNEELSRVIVDERLSFILKSVRIKEDEISVVLRKKKLFPENPIELPGI